MIQNLSKMFYTGLLTGTLLELLLPQEEYINGTRVRRCHFVFGGICLGVVFALIKPDQAKN
jgi:hypothetical protein